MFLIANGSTNPNRSHRNLRDLTHFFNMLIGEFYSAKNQKTDPSIWELKVLPWIGR